MAADRFAWLAGLFPVTGGRGFPPGNQESTGTGARMRITPRGLSTGPVAERRAGPGGFSLPLAAGEGGSR